MPGMVFAQALAEFGADIVLAGIDQERCDSCAAALAKDSGSRVIGIKIDVSDENEVKRSALVARWRIRCRTRGGSLGRCEGPGLGRPREPRRKHATLCDGGARVWTRDASSCWLRLRSNTGSLGIWKVLDGRTAPNKPPERALRKGE